MAQLTIYLDEASLTKINKAAKREHCSVSKWVRDQLEQSLKGAWPKGYEKVLGSLSDTDFERPAQGSSRYDSRRESL